MVVHLDKTPGPHDVNSLSFPSAPPLHGLRLDLEPLTVTHAAEMAPLLDDVDLHTFTGGEPVSLEELTERYRRQVLGRSADGSEAWLNWVVRRRDTGQAAGYLQVTVTREQDLQVAELAWVISPVHQHQGFATEAATAVADWLRSSGITSTRGPHSPRQPRFGHHRPTHRTAPNCRRAGRRDPLDHRNARV